MLLSDLSNASLSNIFNCFNKDIRSIARFSRINERIFKFAVNDNRLKMEFSTLHVYYSKYLECFAVRLKCAGSERMFEKRLFLGKNTIIMKIFKLIDEYGDKCASLPKIIMENFVVDEELLHLLGVTLKPILKLQHLEICNCEFHCTDQQMCKMIRQLNLQELTLNGVKLNQMRISNVLLSQIPKSLGVWFPISPDGIYKEDEVDEQLLINWLYKPPQRAILYHVNHNISVHGVLLFIEKFCRKVMSNPTKTFNHKFDIGQLITDDNSMKQLILAQRNPNLSWKITNICNISQDKDSVKNFYTVTMNEHDVTFTFNIMPRSYRKITKQQARSLLPSLRDRINARRQNNGGRFFYTENSDIYDEIDELCQRMYKDWKDVIAEFYEL